MSFSKDKALAWEAQDELTAASSSWAMPKDFILNKPRSVITDNSWCRACAVTSSCSAKPTLTSKYPFSLTDYSNMQDLFYFCQSQRLFSKIL